MVYCDHCVKNVRAELHEECYLVCTSCGKVLEDQILTEEPTFTKNSAGQSKISGNLVKAVEELDASRKRTLYRASKEMEYLSLSLGVSEGDVVRQARAFYEIALAKNFTRGRKSEQVRAACLYLAFRQNKKPYFLIEFSNNLRINVYELGGVYLQLCEVLRLDNHPIVKKPIDPSLYLHKYTSNLLGHRNGVVSATALNIIAQMNRDWLQTGRKPGGLFAAALYTSANAHGHKVSKRDILRLFHICEQTMNKRLIEYEMTDSSNLTVEELNAMAKENEKNPVVMPNSKFNGSTSTPLVCEHKEMEVPHFALGLCETCYKDFDKVSGGFGGGLDPPAFQRAEQERVKKTNSKENADVVKASNSACKGGDDTSTEAQDESGNFSDIDDQEVDAFLFNEEEKSYRKIIWENQNREYLEEQAAKEAAAAAQKKIYEANLENCPVESRELYESTTASVAKTRKEKQRRAQQAKKSGPAQSAVEAACQMVKRKGLSNKVNMDNFAKLFEDKPADERNPKKVRFDLASDNHDDELGSADYFEDGDNDWYNNENMDESYFPEEDGYNYDEGYY
ncbi:transcription factor IIIB 90 kDa subunit isoform X2 [Medicago truncatula]|uniref:transcription factor IIIB 90 kDa subunit isoform X2 n=1 Tax=Medicago truncatula TaxID=3880 RepID=UPI001968340F|nr:transcription factor IIIB 90 kDa subunit isoform X2 [Medicago truncatula]